MNVKEQVIYFMSTDLKTKALSANFVFSTLYRCILRDYWKPVSWIERDTVYEPLYESNTASLWDKCIAIDRNEAVEGDQTLLLGGMDAREIYTACERWRV